ncbi:EAL domain-containing protein [Actinoplanes sp. NPDC051861]|uniref:putative bifunctional diguanylate cyclase/phosphodiesterase n=1 Tax=Actinoplanes sp. NPDC051861 TaxID=3155170 RepID=UPI0034127F92
MTASLAGVLLALAAYVIQGTLHTTRVTDEQSRALAVDLQFIEARIAIAMQEVNLRHYEVEPSVAVKQRFDQVAQKADATLTAIASGSDPDAQRDAQRLLKQQRAYRALAEKLIVMVADSDPEQVTLDRLEVTPAFYALQNDVDEVSLAYHDDAQRRVAELRQTQVRLLVGTSVGFGAGLVLVAMILKMALGYQRRLVDHAAESRHQALHDPLTGLPNRSLFTRQLETALTGAVDSGHEAALMVIDLDGFKAVNDTLGHHAGDQVLQEAGRRLTAAAGNEALVARLGGDEFAVLMPLVHDRDAAWALGECLVAELRRDFTPDGRTAAIGGSLGIAYGPAHGSGDELFRHADAAMYRAKGNGGGVSVYDADADADLHQDRLQLFGDMRGLLDTGDPDGQLLLHYQPQVRLADAKVTSAEALVRWQHPRQGLLPPAAFLPAAERGGLEVRLTYHLLRLAVRQAARWRDEGWPCRVAVNVSPGVLADAGFVPNVLAALSEVDLPPGLLRLELTETSIMADPERAIRALHRVCDEGVSVSVDDFGTGFSSLAQLRRLPAGELKIDRTFVRDLSPGTPDAVMVRSAIDLGHNLGLRVVAEGVEDVETLVRLREMACDYAQGYALSRPVPAERLRDACDQAQEVAAGALTGRDFSDTH